MSKAEKKMRKARAREVERWDSLAELEQFGDLDVLTKKLDDADVSGKTLSRKSSGMGGISSSKADLAASRSARGVERSASAAVGSKRSRGSDNADEDDEHDSDRPLGLSKQRKSFHSSNDDDDDDEEEEGRMGMGEEEDPLYTALAQAAAHKKAKKVAQREAEKDATSEYVRERADEFLDEGTARGPHGKRSVSREIMKNRGLTKYRSKIERNPRVHNRVKAAKFAMRRKGQVVSMRDPSEGDRYGGEVTGIRTNVIKSRKINS
jgi:U3 small nucleolar RNA-associated protein 3